MSDDKPFAEFFGIDGYRHIKIGGIVFPADGLTEGGIRQDSETLNRRVTARERKAAAKALRDLAASVRAETGVRAPKPSDPFWRDHFAAMADREADAIEKGER